VAGDRIDLGHSESRLHSLQLSVDVGLGDVIEVDEGDVLYAVSSDCFGGP
jgi:hypothetical protein